MATTKDDLYEPEVVDAALVREVDQALEHKLTGKPAVEDLAVALKNAAFEFDIDDQITLSTAEELQIIDEDDYVRGYDVLRELGLLEDRITTHYSRFDKPLNFLIGIVRGCKRPQVASVTPLKQALSKRLGSWKAEKERADAERVRKEQEARDLAAKAAQQAKADALERVAKQEADPQLAASFQAEAENVRAVEVHGAPVENVSSVPQVAGGWTKVTWKAEFTDVKELMRAWIDGRVAVLDEEGIKKGLQPFMDDQASALQGKLHLAFPGTKAAPQYGAVSRRKK